MSTTVHPTGGGDGGHGHWPGGAPSADGAMDDWGFRPLRRAGVSLAAASGSFAPCAGRPKALPLETAIWATRHRLARGVGEEFCGRARPSFAAILDVGQEAGPQLWRKRPGDTRRHTGGKLPHRKNRVKLLSLGALVFGSAQIISVRTLTANSTKATMTTGRTIFAPLRMVNPAPT